MKSRNMRCLLLSALLVLAAPAVWAVETATQPDQPVTEQPKTEVVEDKQQKLVDKVAAQAALLEQLKQEIAQLSADSEKAQDEEQAVLRDQRRRKEAEFRDGLKELVNRIVDMEEAGLDAAELRKTAANHTSQVSTWLKRSIDTALKLLVDLDTRVQSASEEETPDIRQQIASQRQAVDKDLAALLENSDRMELLGLNSTSDLKYLDDTLVQRADILVARLQYLVDQRNGMRKQMIGLPEEEKNKLKEKVASLDGRISSTAANLKITIELMNERKLDAASYKQILIASTGEITKDIFESEVALGLLHEWMETGKKWVIEQGPKWTFKLVIFVLILFVFGLLGKLVKRVVATALGASKLRASTLLQELFVSLAGKAVFLIGLLIALAQVGIQIGPVLAGLGIAGFIIGFALQETLSNFASGVMILIYQPFDVGDAIEAGGVSGKVRHMSLVSTTITTFDNQRVIVPNRKIWGDVIRNVNAEDVRRVDMVFGIGYDDSIELAEEVLHEIVDHHPLVLEDPAPTINLHTLGESSVDFVVRPWVKSADYWTAYWDITRAVKKRFDKEGISIPFPQQDMHVYHHGDAAPDALGKP